MKRTVSILSFVLFTLSLFAQGIGNSKEFVAFAKAYNAGGDISAYCTPDTTVVLTADLDFSKEKNVPQIKNFAGKFDGQGHKIIGWKASAPLFDYILEGAKVKNIVIDKSCILKATSKAETFMLGFIACKSSGIIDGCVNYGTISHKCSYTSNPILIGGIVGSNNYCVLRSANYGKVESVVMGAEQKADLPISVGGIVGGTEGSQLLGTVVAWCENHGEVKVSADYPMDNVGGIAGYPGKAPVKYCVNYGKVSSESIKAEGSQIITQNRVGGIAGFTKGDISCCDNRGVVVTEGIGSGMPAGICGQPHAAVNVTDCVNYGKVSAKSEGQSHVGGISANVGRGVHFRRCINYGDVVFEGVSARDRSCAGGIVGQIYSPKTSTAGTYVRNCANYGKITSSAGGNNYTNNDHAIHTAGVVGFMANREDFKAFLYDCKNEGTIAASGGRKGNICANVKNVTTGGSFPDDDAVKIEPMPDGTNVRGRVCFDDGAPVEGVVVTDGQICTTTDANGFYSMKSDLSKAHFIYISIPSYTMTPTYGGVPQFFRRVSRDDTAVEANFTLTRKAQTDKYTMLMIGDPQVRPFGVDNSMERWTDTVSLDVEQFRASCDNDVYCINLGDLVYNFMTAYDDYLDAAAQIKCPTFNVIGNHDFDQTTMFDNQLGIMYFENYISPEHYSFNIGRVHFVIVNTIQYGRRTADEHYAYGLDDRTMEWLENDLKYVPKDWSIVACSHAQLFKRRGDTPNGSHGALSKNYKRYRAALAQFKEVYSWSGHYHDNFQYNYAGKNQKWGAENIQCITVSRCTGALRLNEYLNSNGTPQGYMVLNIDGGHHDWWYKSVGKDKDYQMRSYAPDESGRVRVNIWNYGDCWTTPEWWENGVKVADMEYTPGVDPAYLEQYSKVTNKTTRKYCKPSTTSDIFSVTPSAGCKGGQVRVKDQFGNEFVSSISW